jgi:hypothetical protein
MPNDHSFFPDNIVHLKNERNLDLDPTINDNLSLDVWNRLKERIRAEKET